MNNDHDLPTCGLCGCRIEQESGYYLNGLLVCSPCWTERMENEDYPLRTKWKPRGKWGNEDEM